MKEKQEMQTAKIKQMRVILEESSLLGTQIISWRPSETSMTRNSHAKLPRRMLAVK